MNVNVHEQGPKFWSLGLIRVKGSMPATKCIELLENKVSDGASVMTKVGRLIEAEQQLCYAHGVQLAVLDALYNRRNKSAMQTAEAIEATENEGEAASDSENGSDDEHESDGDEQGLQVFNENNYNLVEELSGEYHDVVRKARNVVKIFRRSPTKNDDILQPYVKKEFGKEISVILDCRTRWSSLSDMLSRFIMQRSAVQKAMIDLKEPVQLTDADFASIQEVVATLEPVKIAVKAICRRETNLINAEAALKLCIVELQKQSSELAKTLAESLKTKIKERRAVHAGVQQYLHTAGAYETANDVI